MPVRFRILRAVAAMGAAWALLLQVVVVGPVAFRMAAADVAQVVCDAHGEGQASHGPGSAPKHGCDQCLLCQGHAVPFAVVGGGVGLLLARRVIQLPRPRAAARAIRHREAATYRSRAPPAMA